MKKAWVVASVLVLASAAAFAEAPSDAAVHLAAIFAPPANAGACAAKIAGALPLAKGGPGIQCVATADCYPYADVNCSSGSGTCIAVDRNCPNTQGYVTCNGATTYCTPDCSDPCEGLSGFCLNCCQTDDCFACCRCGGGGGVQCALECG
jgi:hypothetical protein